MIKFIVVLYRRDDVRRGIPHDSTERSRLDGERIPGLRKYVQNHVAPSPAAAPWLDAVIELYWDDWAAMEAAWRTPEGQRATDHLAEFVDLSRSTWSVVVEETRR